MAMLPVMDPVIAEVLLYGIIFSSPLNFRYKVDGIKCFHNPNGIL